MLMDSHMGTLGAPFTYMCLCMGRGLGGVGGGLKDSSLFWGPHALLNTSGRC